MKEILVAPASAESFKVIKGQSMRIVDVEGHQAGDLIVFSSRNKREKFSQARTRVENHSIKITRGGQLWSNTTPPYPMLTVVEDTCGVHDILFTPCSRWAMEKRWNTSHDGCYENLARALTRWGISSTEIVEAFNLFMNVAVSPEGTMTIREPTSKAGDYVTFRAEVDCIVGVSACALEKGPVNAGSCKPFKIELLSEDELVITHSPR